MAARGGPPDPTAEEKLPHPIIQSVPKLHKTIRHPGKARLPRLYWTPPPCGGTDASKTPTPEPGPSACTNPCFRRHTNQDPSPPGPADNSWRRGWDSAADRPRPEDVSWLITLTQKGFSPKPRKVSGKGGLTSEGSGPSLLVSQRIRKRVLQTVRLILKIQLS